MNVHIFLKKQVALFKWEMVPIANVELEVVPKGLYVIDGTTYRTVDVPKFIIETSDRGESDTLKRVEITVEIPDPET